MHPLREQPWKQLVVRFYDPDYNIIEVGEPMEKMVLILHKTGFTTQEIQKQTGLEQSFIVKSLEE